jgi:hypothetical protein
MRFTLRTLMLAIGLVSLVLGVVAFSLRPKVSRFSVVNRSGRPVSRLLFSVSGDQVVFRNVPDGSTVSAPFPSHGLDDFEVTGTLADGTALKGGFGFRSDVKRGSHPVFTIAKGGDLWITDGR